MNSVKDSCYYYRGVYGCVWLGLSDGMVVCRNPEKCTGKKPADEYDLVGGRLVAYSPVPHRLPAGQATLDTFSGSGKRRAEA